MSPQPVDTPEVIDTNQPTNTEPPKKSSRMILVMAITSVILTMAMFAAIIIFNEEVKEMQRWGYLGAFLISILGGATIIIPVPMLAVIVALASAAATPFEVAMLGLSAAAGEVIGALIIYYTGHGAGSAINSPKHTRIQKVFNKMVGFIERRGSWALFAVTFIINPLFYPAAFVCGAIKFRLSKFLIVVTIGKLIKCMTVVYAAFYGLKSLFHALGIEI
jgi:membrane protein DedA with SNARE-associated domain